MPRERWWCLRGFGKPATGRVRPLADTALNTYSVKERGSHGALRSQLSCRAVSSRRSLVCRSNAKDEAACASCSDSPRYWSRFCDWSYMPLEPCPTCGYALSVHDHRCRHCASAPPAGPSLRFDVNHLPQIIIALIGLGLLVYFIFLHGFS